ncbi:MAG TPA: mersacidin/lichenicidin family type 2 lantibiotic [Herpetosiphonaceae bacterium]
MSIENIIRAWKDEEYRASLSETERVALPEHPAGLVELADEDLGVVAGGNPNDLVVCTVISTDCC